MHRSDSQDTKPAVHCFGTAVLIPCAFSLAASLAPDNRTAALSHVAMVSGLPRVAAPSIFGWDASAHGLGAAFSLLGVVLLYVLRPLDRASPAPLFVPSQ